MIITFKNKAKEMKGEALFVSVGPKNTDEIIKENSTKTLYLKSDENMNLRKLFLLVRKMVMLAKGVKAEKIVFDFKDFKFAKIK